ncbi:MAG: integral rane sensor signal transduction histidine kinase [Oerskovia sp.]|nr:integral rane sensor signal transduction histidine kinase [Oerskovia sp.]
MVAAAAGARACESTSVSTEGAPEFTDLSARRLGPVRRFLARRPVVVDVLLLVVFAGWSLLVGVGADSMYVLHAYLGDDAVQRMQVWSAVLTAAGTTALAWRRRRPVTVAAVVTGLGVLALATTGATSGFELGVAFALYAVATARRPLVTWASLAGSVLALLTAGRLLDLPSTVGALSLGLGQAAVQATQSGGASTVLLDTVWLRTVAAPVAGLALLAVAVGTSVRNRRQHLAGFVAAANALARDQDQRARLAQAAERARIAREMHDVVAHSVSVMVALSDGAGAALDRAPDRSREALRELSRTGRGALSDMQGVLGALDPGEGADAGTGGSAEPVAADLAMIVERFRAAGIPVRARGLDVDLPQDTALRLAVARVVTEALTNVLRHAPGTPRAEVAVRRGPSGLEVEVLDDGGTRPGTGGGSGRGILGMRERAALLDGRVEAGPRPGGGWRVHVVLPVDDDRRPAPDQGARRGRTEGPDGGQG